MMLYWAHNTFLPAGCSVSGAGCFFVLLTRGAVGWFGCVCVCQTFIKSVVVCGLGSGQCVELCKWSVRRVCHNLTASAAARLQNQVNLEVGRLSHAFLVGLFIYCIYIYILVQLVDVAEDYYYEELYDSIVRNVQQ